MSCGYDGEHCREEYLEKEILQLEADVSRWREAEGALSKAYLRLRRMIPGALDTPTAPTREQVWETTEAALKRLGALARSRRRGEPPYVTPRSVPEPDR